MKNNKMGKEKLSLESEIKCPKCKSTFDVSESLVYYKNQFLFGMEELIKKIKSGEKIWE